MSRDQRSSDTPDTTTREAAMKTYRLIETVEYEIEAEKVIPMFVVNVAEYLGVEL